MQETVYFILSAKHDASLFESTLKKVGKVSFTTILDCWSTSLYFKYELDETTLPLVIRQQLRTVSNEFQKGI